MVRPPGHQWQLSVGYSLVSAIVNAVAFTYPKQRERKLENYCYWNGLSCKDPREVTSYCTSRTAGERVYRVEARGVQAGECRDESQDKAMEKKIARLNKGNKKRCSIKRVRVQSSMFVGSELASMNRHMYLP
ncbi:hypothetical protein ASPWEDRAFT_30386 [Aspergillus wentii DTO 134E9]|uniref:Uncharacterized protein n=1 Tax=Aspergillus wentii DTO 134E9 TaxID=1073089 RepID=A0A1L9REG0_ASPWE|nr:uncharacterized protein ASPWEDRAFT_30386 [Aspergillus wentii DTO 134E9]OJJ33295.1 hypothetical protein ASPWEDRAFT_30386 [Aspergillus wentii DTO 134E9]